MSLYRDPLVVGFLGWFQQLPNSPCHRPNKYPTYGNVKEKASVDYARDNGRPRKITQANRTRHENFEAPDYLWFLESIA